jgi:hypothetical protein
MMMDAWKIFLNRQPEAYEGQAEAYELKREFCEHPFVINENFRSGGVAKSARKRADLRDAVLEGWRR